MEEDASDSELHHLRAQRLKDRLAISVIQIAELEAQKSNCAISTPVMTAVVDLTFKYAEQLARDLEMFSQHAGRKSINVDDVILAAHRNEDVALALRLVSQDLSKSKDQPQDRKRKKAVVKTD